MIPNQSCDPFNPYIFHPENLSPQFNEDLFDSSTQSDETETEFSKQEDYCTLSDDDNTTHLCEPERKSSIPDFFSESLNELNQNSATDLFYRNYHEFPNPNRSKISFIEPFDLNLPDYHRVRNSYVCEKSFLELLNRSNSNDCLDTILEFDCCERDTNMTSRDTSPIPAERPLIKTSAPLYRK